MPGRARAVHLPLTLHRPVIHPVRRLQPRLHLEEVPQRAHHRTNEVFLRLRFIGARREALVDRADRLQRRRRFMRPGAPFPRVRQDPVQVMVAEEVPVRVRGGAASVG